MIVPLNQLSSAMKRIEHGDTEFRITEKSAGSEFEQINKNFNRMLDEMSELKIDVYEQQLEKEKIRRCFLSQQIQPHFILNAMNILYSYEQDEYPLIQKMICLLYTSIGNRYRKKAWKRTSSDIRGKQKAAG